MSTWRLSPQFGMVSFINPAKIRHKRDPGRCFRKAGFHLIGKTKSDLLVYQMSPAKMPDPQEPMLLQLRLAAAGGAR